MIGEKTEDIRETIDVLSFFSNHAWKTESQKGKKKGRPGEIYHTRLTMWHGRRQGNRAACTTNTIEKHVHQRPPTARNEWMRCLNWGGGGVPNFFPGCRPSSHSPTLLGCVKSLPRYCNVSLMYKTKLLNIYLVVVPVYVIFITM